MQGTMNSEFVHGIRSIEGGATQVCGDESKGKSPGVHERAGIIPTKYF